MKRCMNSKSICWWSSSRAEYRGLLGVVGMELELSRMLGHKVDLRTPEDLSRYFRQSVLDEAQVQYAQE